MRDQWVKARVLLLRAEKELTRRSDELAREFIYDFSASY
jgi:predicted dithiol-disulfide oxidoreductase (DUF899 family)